MTSSDMQIVAVVAIVFRGERLLAMRRAAHKPAAGMWETLSGRVAAGEDPLVAVEREIDEECGLEVRIDPRPFTSYSAMRGTEPMIVIVYVAEWTTGEVRRSEEHDAHDWLTPDELAARSELGKLVEVVRAAAAGRSRKVG